MKTSRILAFCFSFLLLTTINSAFAQDPGTPGPLAVTREEYNFGDTAFQPTNFPGPVELRASIHYPTALAGPYPVIVLLHGRHATCFKGGSQLLQWPCTNGAQTIPSFQGYDYVAESLASNGYVVVSVSANGVNAVDNQVFDLGALARAELMQKHLDILNGFNTTGGAPFGTKFVGKFDLTRVGTMGHSRGGEGVVRHYVLNNSLGAPYGIKAVFPLAPVDFKRKIHRYFQRGQAPLPDLFYFLLFNVGKQEWACPILCCSIEKRTTNLKQEQVRKGGLPPLLLNIHLNCIFCDSPAYSRSFLMTKKWSNLNLPGALHYVTGNVLHRIPIFRDDQCCVVFLEVFSGLLFDWPAKLVAFVLMPDHFHLIVNPRDGNIKGFAGALKSLSSRKIVDMTQDKRFQRWKPDKDSSTHQVWQESFKAMPLWSLWMIWQKINYIHANPVKARLVASAKDYAWSSFRSFYSISNEPLSVDHDWWWHEDPEKLSKAMKELGWNI